LKDDKGNVTRFNLVRGGCPYGTGEQGCGHLGYFLKSEFNKAIKHEEGTVGFWREMLDDESVSELSNLLRRDTAGCRFYITLGPAAVMDGHYSVIGKVTKGIDIVKQINAMPTISESEVPQKLIRMKSVSMK
jgi:cyclophilin family peptidyl-prolyl cis-trans isomerase